MSTTTTRTEWAVRYGDGEVEGPLSYTDARRLRRDCRDTIRSGEVPAGDYEPMTLVRRRVHIEISDWEGTKQ